MKQGKIAILALMCAFAIVFGCAPTAFALDEVGLGAGEIDTSYGDGGEDAVAPTDLRSLNLVIYESYKYDDNYYTCTYAMNRHIWSGKAIKPKPAVCVDEYGDAEYGPDYLTRLTNGVDYKLSYKSNVNAGVARVFITGINGYSGTVSKTFRICVPIKNAKVAKVSAKTYKGKAFKPAPKITYKGKALKKGADYALLYKNNVKAGTAKIIVKGKGKYGGTKVVAFKIKKRSLKKASIAKVAKKAYNGKLKKPQPKVKLNGKTLKRGTDYTLSYAKNRNPGIAKIIIKGKGNYAGKRVVKFRIVKSAPAPTASSGGYTVYITNTGAKYHRGSCRWLYASKIPVSVGDAIARGYEPCKVCKP